MTFQRCMFDRLSKQPLVNLLLLIELAQALLQEG
jgi:hypothetical protein